jgi:hypothetical protein
MAVQTEEYQERIVVEPGDASPEQPDGGKDRAVGYTVGVILIGLGIIFLAMTMGLLAGAAMGLLWPFFMIVPGAMMLFGGDRSKIVGGLVLLGLGMVFLSTTTGLLPWSSMGYVWPLFLIIPGLALLFGRAAPPEA